MVCPKCNGNTSEKIGAEYYCGPCHFFFAANKSKTEPSPSPAVSLGDAPDVTLAEAKEYLVENIWKGTHCPCCTQWTKVYPYTFHTGMVKSLAYIYSAYQSGHVKPGEYFHVEKYFKKEVVVNFHGYHSKLKYWGLLEQGDNLEPSKHKSGFWRITQKGVDFIEGRAAVRKVALLFNDTCLDFDGPELCVTEILEDFDYRKIMASLT